MAKPTTPAPARMGPMLTPTWLSVISTTTNHNSQILMVKSTLERFLMRLAAAPGIVSVLSVARISRLSKPLKALRSNFMTMNAAAKMSATRTSARTASTPMINKLATNESQAFADILLPPSFRALMVLSQILPQDASPKADGGAGEFCLDMLWRWVRLPAIDRTRRRYAQVGLDGFVAYSDGPHSHRRSRRRIGAR